MNNLPYTPDEDYDGNKGCLIMIVTVLTIFGAIGIAIIIGVLTSKLIELLS